MKTAVLFETIMLIGFGCSWPFNIAKSLKSKTTLGKSVYFEIIVIISYLFGVAAKLIIFRETGELQYSFWFYIIDINVPHKGSSVTKRNFGFIQIFVK